MMDYSFTIVPGVLMSGLVFFNFMFARRKFKDLRIDIINGLLCYQVFSQFTFPMIYGFIENYPNESEWGVLPRHLVITYIVELISVFCWMIGFYFFRPFYNRLKKVNIFPSLSNESVNRFMVFLVIAMIYCMIANSIKGLGQFGMPGQYDAQNLGENVLLWPIGISIPLSLWLIIINLFYFPGIFAATILATSCYPKHSGKKLAMLGWITIGLMIFWGMVTALRQFIMGAVLLIIVIGLAQQNKKVLKYSLIGIILLLMLAPLMQDDYREMLGDAQIARSLGPIERIAVLFSMKKNSVEEVSPMSKVWHATGWRYVDASFGSGLIKAADRGDYAGFMPFISSLAAPIPRLFWPDKPAPGSSDGTNEGIATIVVFREMTGQSWGICGPFTTGSHAFWELGLPGVIFFGMISGLFARSVLCLTQSAGKLGLLIWGLSWNPLAFFANLWVPQIIKIILQGMLPLVVLMWCWYWYSRLRFSKSVN